MSKVKLDRTIKYLEGKKKILFLLTSNRWSGHKDDIPKSSQLAYHIQKIVGPNKVTIMDVSKLKIHDCEGNVSFSGGNNCGLKSALLSNKLDKTGNHRCWASYNNPDDELYKIVNELLISDCVVFFGSVRWGKMNAIYGKLVERLTWLENRHTTLGESNLLKGIDSGLISVGHNWRGDAVIGVERQVLEYFGFKTPKELFWSYQWTKDSNDETKSGYKKSNRDFLDEFFGMVKESIIKFREYSRNFFHLK